MTFSRFRYRNRGTPKPISSSLTILIMRQLSLTDTQNLVAKLVKSLGERGAARALNKMGYRSPESCEIKQGHISRVQAGSWTCFLAPEEPIESIPGPAPSPIAARPPIPEKTPENYLEQGPALAPPSEKITIDPQPGPLEVRRRLREELLNEEADRKEREENSPPFVPHPSDHSRSEHSHIERSARVSGIFNRRGEVQFDETKEDYFGLPRLQRQPTKVISRPYEPRSYAKLPMSPTEPYRLQSKKS